MQEIAEYADCRIKAAFFDAECGAEIILNPLPHILYLYCIETLLCHIAFICSAV
jgi:hypothetical protein